MNREERRAHPRSSVGLRVEMVDDAGKTTAGTTVDISLGGLMVELERPAFQDSTASLSVFVGEVADGNVPTCIWLAGRVLRVQRNRAAIELQDTGARWPAVLDYAAAELEDTQPMPAHPS